MSAPMDDSRYLAMIKNRPPITMLPKGKPRLLMQYTGFNAVVFGTALYFVGHLFYRQIEELRCADMYNTRKQFKGQPDPYSGTVSVLYRESPYKPSGY